MRGTLLTAIWFNFILVSFSMAIYIFAGDEKWFSRWFLSNILLCTIGIIYAITDRKSGTDECQK